MRAIVLLILEELEELELCEAEDEEIEEDDDDVDDDEDDQLPRACIRRSRFSCVSSPEGTVIRAQKLKVSLTLTSPIVSDPPPAAAAKPPCVAASLTHDASLEPSLSTGVKISCKASTLPLFLPQICRSLLCPSMPSHV
jgi:hypothetical protein